MASLLMEVRCQVGAIQVDPIQVDPISTVRFETSIFRQRVPPIARPEDCSTVTNGRDTPHRSSAKAFSTFL
jgi:hypothetical protein